MVQTRLEVFVCVCVCAGHLLCAVFPLHSVQRGIQAREMRRLMTRGSTSHKHTYLASCHHVGEFGMLVDCQAQNVVTVFCIETLTGCKETHPHTSMNRMFCLLLRVVESDTALLLAYRSSGWARCRPRRCGRWCPPPHSGSARYCGSHCHGNQTLAPTPGPVGVTEKEGQESQKGQRHDNTDVRCQLAADVARRLLDYGVITVPPGGLSGHAHCIFSRSGL